MWWFVLYLFILLYLCLMLPPKPGWVWAQTSVHGLQTARPDSPSFPLSVFPSLVDSHCLCHSRSHSYTLFYTHIPSVRGAKMKRKKKAPHQWSATPWLQLKMMDGRVATVGLTVLFTWRVRIFPGCFDIAQCLDGVQGLGVTFINQIRTSSPEFLCQSVTELWPVCPLQSVLLWERLKC